MNTHPGTDADGLPVFEGEADAAYTVDILARLSGVSSETILLYHERGLLRQVAPDSPQPCFDDEAVRRLRRLESVRENCALTLAGVCLVSRLLDEIDQLRDQLRHRSAE